MEQVREREHKVSIVNANITAFKSPKQKKQLKMLLLIMAVIILGGIVAYFTILPKQNSFVLKNYQTAKVQKGEFLQSVQASGSVVIPTQFKVISSVQAYAESLFADEGDSVYKGQLLAQLYAPDLEEQLEDLKINTQNAELNSKKTIAQNKFNLDKLQRDVAKFDADIKEAEEEVGKYQDLAAINAGRQSDLDAAIDKLNELKQSRYETQISLNQEIELQKIDSEIRAAEIKQYETKIERTNENIKDLRVTSPMNGEILSMESSLSVPGSLITANSVLFTISDPVSAIVELEVLEDYAGVIQEGQKIVLTISGIEMYGIILNIGKVAEMSSDGLGATVLVKVKPDTGQSLLLGSTAVGTIEINKKENALFLPRGPYLTTGSQRFVYKVSGVKAERIEVSFGETQTNRVEVLEGLNEGDVIIASGYQNFIDHKEILLQGE
ncbi:MAG: efflux RND transporter periplasmic adaptor subunit [Spirochaetales bacterium]|nr:efflux RND transporter periplasmic adaptor subunit [Spirochaetales bacterium]